MRGSTRCWLVGSSVVGRKSAGDGLTTEDTESTEVLFGGPNGDSAVFAWGGVRGNERRAGWKARATDPSSALHRENTRQSPHKTSVASVLSVVNGRRGFALQLGRMHRSAQACR